MRRSPVPHRFDLALALRRRPRHRRAVVVAVAVLCGVAVMTVVQNAEDAAAAWGERVPVLVATDDLEPGDRLDGGNTRIAQQPAPLVPRGAVTAPLDDVRLAEPVYAGEIVREERLAPEGLSAVAARLPAGTRAMAIPVEPGTVPALVLGDRVDVLVALAAEAAGDGPPGFALATDVLVVDVSAAAVTVAVRADTAPRIAVALGAGAVTLALTDQRTA
ncbi:MAG: SAF domain-containing protein [Acidimicrobiales bacterium]